MSQTGYSTYYSCELDVRQLLQRMQVTKTLSQVDYELTALHRDWIRNDVLCPSCRCKGASVVRSEINKSGRGNTRQAHFRFIDAFGHTSHAQGCDFFRMDDVPGVQKGVDISFVAKDKDTRLVRDLVCRAISIGELSKTDIFDMRTWFLGQRTTASFVVAGDPAMVDWLYALHTRPAIYLPLKFEPIHKALPGFNARTAANRDLVFKYQDFRRTFPRVLFDAPARDRTKRIIQHQLGLPLISMQPLKPYYDAKLQLAMLMADYGNLPLVRRQSFRNAPNKLPEVLLGFAAALLFVSQWQVTVALERFARILASAPPQDLTAGNVIGFNPFHDFAALELVRFIAGLRPVTEQAYNFDQEILANQLRIQAD